MFFLLKYMLELDYKFGTLLTIDQSMSFDFEYILQLRQYMHISNQQTTSKVFHRK